MPATIDWFRSSLDELADLFAHHMDSCVGLPVGPFFAAPTATDPDNT